MSLIPDVEQTEKEAKAIRLELLSHFKDYDLFMKQSYEHKRRFLSWLFSSYRYFKIHVDKKYPYAIYLTKINDLWNIAIHGRVDKNIRFTKEGFSYSKGKNILKQYRTAFNAFHAQKRL